jgi:DNA-binding GntR family transcriptional regulator
MSLSDRAYEAIRDGILFHVFEPGTIITEGALGDRYGIGKTPVREALVKLEQEHLVESRPRKGYEVAPLTLARARDMFLVRRLLEPPAARLAAQHGIDATELATVERLAAEETRRRSAVDPADHNSVIAFVKANSAFHLRIAKASGSLMLERMLQEVIVKLDRYVFLAIVHSADFSGYAQSHSQLIEALRAPDPDAAARVVQDQVDWAERAVVDALLSTPSIQNARLRA